MAGRNKCGEKDIIMNVTSYSEITYYLGKICQGRFIPATSLILLNEIT